jgi:hypothetical protein
MIANNKIRVEAQDHPSDASRRGQVVTIVDVAAQSLIRSREDSARADADRQLGPDQRRAIKGACA